MSIPLVDLKAQYASIKPEIDDAIARVIAKTAFIQGEEVRAFEREFAAFCKAKHSIGMASGTAAIHLALFLAGVGPGDEVITTTMTFTASAEPIEYLGAKPVLLDIDPRTYNLDTRKLEAAITPHTKVIMPVHLYGQPADMDTVLAVARKHNLFVLEDAAQAHGAEYRGTRIGNFGHAAIFSFYPGKNLGAYGDAGAIVTNDDDFAARARMMADHGRTEKYTHSQIGFGYRLDSLQAAILRAKLPHLEGWNDARRARVRRYNERLAGLDLVTPFEPDYVRAVYHIYAVRLARRDDVAKALKAKGVV